MKIKVKNYLSLVKFSHTIFAMPFALIGFFLGVIYSRDVYQGSFTLNQYQKKVEGYSDNAKNDYLNRWGD